MKINEFFVAAFFATCFSLFTSLFASTMFTEIIHIFFKSNVNLMNWQQIAQRERKQKMAE